MTPPNDIIGISNAESPLIFIQCPCGAEFEIGPSNAGWAVEMVGPWAFTHKCGHKITVPNQEMKTSISNNPQWATL